MGLIWCLRGLRYTTINEVARYLFAESVVVAHNLYIFYAHTISIIMAMIVL